MSSQQSTNNVVASILERARAVQAAYLEREEAAARAYAEKKQAEFDEEWQPIVEVILKEMRAQLGDDAFADFVDIGTTDDGGALMTGNGWTLQRRAGSPLWRPDYEREYQPLKLYIDGIYTPVMCWAFGTNGFVAFEPATIEVDRDDDDKPTFWVGDRCKTIYEISNGNDDLLYAIAQAADKQDEYIKKFNYVHSTPEPSPSPEGDAPAKLENLEAAGEILRRFSAGKYCVPAFADQHHDDLEMKVADNRAFLIASQIHALAVEVGKLHDTLRINR